MRSIRSNLLLLLTLLVTLLVLAPPATAAQLVSLEPYAFQAANGETVSAELGKLRVPEKRAKPDGRQIELAFVRFASTAEEPGPPIVYLAGGPGGSGISAARGDRFGLFMALREVGDVIAFDQRGTGMSTPRLLCPDPYLLPLDQPGDRAAMAEIVVGAAGRCAGKLTGNGNDLGAYNTRESADDLEDLRRALGAPKLTLWGISYGTHLALATLERHGEQIDRVILAGIEALDQSLKLPDDQQALLEAIARDLTRDPAVRAAVPDLLGSLEKIRARLADRPVSVDLIHPATWQASPVTVGPFDLQVVVADMLRGPDSFRTLPDLVARLESGDFVPLALASSQMRMGRGFDLMALAMDCASGATAERLALIERQAAGTLLADAINFPFPEICRGVGVPDLGDDFRAPVRSEVPALVISGTMDGRTPPTNAETLLPYLPNARHLVIENAGHSDPLFLSSPEILETMLRFARGEKVSSRQIRAEPVDYVAPRQVVAVSDEVLGRYVGDYRIEGGDDVRTVFQAGPLLWTRRGSGQPLPLRPRSETEFFYEHDASRLRFVLDDEGRVTRMVLDHEGGPHGEEAVRVE